MEFIVPVSLFLLIGWSIKVISDNRTRRIALRNDNINESIKQLWEKYYENKPNQNIKWGLIFIIVGLFILINEFFHFSGEIITGICLVSIGITFFGYYWWSKINH